MIKLFDIAVAAETYDELRVSLESLLMGSSKNRVYKVNTEFLARAIRDKKFNDVLKGAQLVIPDGRGVLWAAKYLTLPMTKNKFFGPIQAFWQMIYSGAAIVFYPKFICSPIPEAIPGVEALLLMLKVAEKENSGVFFFGADQGDLDAAIENIKKEFPELKISGSLNGYDWQEKKSIDPVEIINRTDAKLLVVALGSPLQEYWIDENIEKLNNVRLAVGEGGSLAFLAGSLKRAPKWINRIGLEWLWRLFMNRSLTHQTGNRLKRVWNAVPVFIYQTVKYKIEKGQNE